MQWTRLALWNGSEEDGNVRGYCDGGTDWYREIESDMLCIFSVTN